MAISLYSLGCATLFTGLHRGVEHEGTDMISHSTFALSVTVHLCANTERIYEKRHVNFGEKYSKCGKSKNLFISVEMSFLPTLATVLQSKSNH